MSIRTSMLTPVLGMAGGGLALGLALHLATPTTPLPPVEPSWKHASGASEAYYSAETYAANAQEYPAAQTYADHEAMAPQLLASVSYTPPARTRYDDPPQYRDDPAPFPAAEADEQDQTIPQAGPDTAIDDAPPIVLDRGDLQTATP